MGAASGTERNEAARAMLDFGFSNYALYSENEHELELVDVLRGVKDEVPIYSSGFSKLVNKADKKRIEKEFVLPDTLSAPIKEGDVVGSVVYKIGEEIIGQSDVFVKENVGRITVMQLFGRIIKSILTGKL